MRSYSQDRDGEWQNSQIMTNEKKFSRFLFETEYITSTDGRFVEYPSPSLWKFKIIGGHCPTCGHQLEDGDEGSTQELMFKNNDEKEYKEVIKCLKKYLAGAASYAMPVSRLRRFEMHETGESGGVSLKISTKHHHYHDASMEFENKKEVEDFLNFLQNELVAAESIEIEDRARQELWHNNRNQ